MSDASLVLYHHPFSRAANAVWMLEEVGRPYELRYVDMAAGEHRAAELRAKNPMGKLPVLTDGDVVVTELSAIGMYLADRYAYGTLCPRVDEPERGTYLRWISFAPSVIEPAAMARAGKWEYRKSQAGWGDYDDVMASIEHAIGDGPWLLGERFTMADVIFGGTVRYMLMFEMLEARPAFADYVARLNARPASERAQARNAAIVQERGLGR